MGYFLLGCLCFSFLGLRAIFIYGIFYILINFFFFAFFSILINENLNMKYIYINQLQFLNNYATKLLGIFLFLCILINDKNISKRLIIQNHVLYVFYYMYKFNRKYTIKKNFFKRFYYHNILTFNFLKKKLNITYSYKNNLISSITPGIITKKLDIINKKNKKSSKIVNIMIKSILKTYRKNENFHKLIIQIKGTRSSFFKVLIHIKDIIKKYTDTYFMYTPVMSFNKKGFKKIRSLKRNFKKKYFKN